MIVGICAACAGDVRWEGTGDAHCPCGMTVISAAFIAAHADRYRARVPSFTIEKHGAVHSWTLEPKIRWGRLKRALYQISDQAIAARARECCGAGVRCLGRARAWVAARGGRSGG